MPNSQSGGKRIMKETTILNLLSASKTLADHKPLNKSESTAIKELLDCLLDNKLPTPREISRYKECKELIRECKNTEQQNYFLPTIENFEQKYTLFI